MSICLLLKLIGCFGSKLLIRKSEASKNNLFTWPCQLLIMLMMRWRSFSWISVFRLWRLGWSWCSVRTDLMKRILTSGGHFLQTEKYFNIRKRQGIYHSWCAFMDRKSSWELFMAKTGNGNVETLFCVGQPRTVCQHQNICFDLDSSYNIISKVSKYKHEIIFKSILVYFVFL